MSIRRAILIEASLSKYGDLPGARADVAALSQFLHCDTGGAWNFDEIVTLSSPSRLELDKKLKAARCADYALISFSGHGEHKYGNPVYQTTVCINDREEVLIRDLNPANDRCLIIADSCRKLSFVAEEEARLKALSLSMAESYTRIRHRQEFDNAVSRADKGCIMMYGCSVDESAGESKQGGYFSTGLILCSSAWAHSTSGVFSTKEAFDCSAIRVNKIMPQQHPEYEGGRRSVHFPFAVSV